MILAAHPINYLPDISFFQKMACADIFVLADDIQYSKHREINRTRIKTADGARWLTVPVCSKGRMGQLINQVEIDDHQNWARKHCKSILVNYKYTPYFEMYSDVLFALYQKDWRLLADLNLELIKFLREALCLSCRIHTGSETGVSGQGRMRVLNLLQYFDCRTYVCGMESKAYLDAEPFERHGFELKMVEWKTRSYHQQFGQFIPNLSVVDLLFNEGDLSPKLIGN